MTAELVDSVSTALIWLCVVVAVIMSARLVAGAAIGLVARKARDGRPSGWLGTPAARRWLGIGLGLAAVVGSRPAASGSVIEPTAAVMIPLGDDTPTVPSTAAMSPLDDAPAEPESGDAVLTPLDPPSPPSAPTVPPAAPTAPTDDVIWTVAPGEHLWHIAEATLSERSSAGAVVSDVDVAGYLQLLVAANRDVLVDPENPDLIFPGQEVRLP